MERFYSKTLRNPANGCLEWQAGTYPSGYGCFWYQGKTRRANRVAWMIEKGDPGTLFVCHTCDNPLCVDIEHLFLGTPFENNQDKTSKDRVMIGVKVKSAKLTDQQVLEIRQRSANGESTTQMLDDYPVDRSNLNRVISGENWQRVGGPLRESQPRRKLTDKQIEDIRNSTGQSATECAKLYGVSQPYVSRIRNGQRRNVASKA